jgi:Tat protein secretion system quality control protein TatD with DNase activity
LAGRLQRPVSIHCVRAFGQFFEAVQQILKEGV